MKELLAALLLFVLALGHGLKAAPPQDMYFVKGTPAVHEAASAAEARPIAISRARSAAMGILLARLLPAKTAAGVPMPSAAQLDKFTRQFNIENERMGERTYSADLSVQFDRTQIEEWLKEQGLSPLTAELPPILLFISPDYVEVAQKEVAARGSSAVPDVKFKASSPAELALAKALPMLELQDELTASATASAAVLEISGDEGRYEIRLTDKARAEPLTFTSKEDLPGAIRSALILLADTRKLSSRAKGANESIMAVLYFSSFEDWLKKERTIVDLTDVEGIRLAAMKFDRAQLDIKHRSTLDALIAALTREGFQVESRANYLVMR